MHTSPLRPRLRGSHPGLTTAMGWSFLFLVLQVVLLPASGLAPCRAEVTLLAAWEGGQAGEQFGVALAIGGDLDQDGRVDLAVGASANDEAGDNAGKLSLFLGRSNPSAVPDLEIYGDPDSFFGSAVAFVPDVNGDGFDELLVGAYRHPGEGPVAGRAYLFLGGDPVDAVADLVLTGPGEGSYFGRAVAGLGDVNADGFGDFAVGAPRTTAGEVWVYFGGDTVDDVPDLILTGVAEDSRFGNAIAGTGNVDGNPGNDILVGAPLLTEGHLWQGGAYLFSGGTALDSLPDWTATGAGAGDQFGHAVAAAGDFNGDGHTDLGVGAPYENLGAAVDVGAAYLYHGGPGLDSAADFSLTGDFAEDNLGFSVAGAGDVSGSGFGHLLVGVPGRDDPGADSGLVVVIPGGEPPSPDDFLYLSGEAASDQYGYVVAGIAPRAGGSFTGASAPDFCVGAWGAGEAGKAYLYGQPGDLSAAPVPAPMTGLTLRAAPNPAPRFEIRLEAPAEVPGLRTAGIGRLQVISCEGRLVRSLSIQHGGDGHSYRAYWDGTDETGQEVATGRYAIVLRQGERTLRSRAVLLLK